MLLIYLDEVYPTFFLHRETAAGRIYYFDQLTVPYAVTSDITEYLSSPIENKIAVLYNRELPLSRDHEFLTTYFEQIKAASRLVFLIELELYGARIFETYIGNNVYAVVPGFNNTHYNNVIFKSAWFDMVIDLYKKFPDILDSIDYTTPKKFYFDALLGTSRHNRAVVYSSIIDNNLEDKIFVNNDLGKFILEPGTVIPSWSRKEHTSNYVTYKDHWCHLSCIIPTIIYNQSAYSIITETIASQTDCFYTEKTIKPILGRRLFVAFASYKFLENLRRLGFKTFDAVIDESYDQIEENIPRWEAAFEQVKYLCSIDQKIILEKIQPIVEHNYQLAMSEEFANMPIKSILSKVVDII